VLHGTLVAGDAGLAHAEAPLRPVSCGKGSRGKQRGNDVRGDRQPSHEGRIADAGAPTVAYH
jgi:hypothetical protein